MKFLLIFLLFCNCAFARLGETTAQLVERFGPSKFTSAENTLAQGRMMTIGDRMSFTQDDWRIVCVVIEGRCAKITYSKTGDWTDQQVQTVLTSNAQGAPWTKTSPDTRDKFQKTWVRADKATAAWNQFGFQLEHPAYDLAKKRAADKAKGEASKTPKI